MIHFFSFITHAKVAKLVLSGEPDNNQPFGIVLKGFFVYIIFFQKKKDFLKLMSNIRKFKDSRSIWTCNLKVLNNIKKYP